MPFESILYVAFVVAMFTQFAIVLTYAEWATRHANGHQPPFRKVARTHQPKQREELASLRKAA
jgi:hypothetical protein